MLKSRTAKNNSFNKMDVHRTQLIWPKSGKKPKFSKNWYPRKLFKQAHLISTHVTFIYGAILSGRCTIHNCKNKAI